MSFPNEVPESGTFIERELSYMLYEFLGKELLPTIFAQQTHRGSALRSILDGFHFKDELCSLYSVPVRKWNMRALHNGIHICV